MQLIYFTKFLKGYTFEKVGETAKSMGFDGLDLAIRPGQCVNPENVSDALPKALKVWRGQGLTVPLATLAGDAINPRDKGVEAILAACAEGNVRLIKLGYWLWKQTQWPGAQLSYWKGVDLIRESLAEFQRLGEKFGVRCLVHTHSDNYYGLNASSARHLVNGFDPRYIGIYLDPAHLAIDGEVLPMGIDICGEYLHMVAAKNMRYVPADGKEVNAANVATWKHDGCQLYEGLVNWPEAIKALKAAGYNGPVSVHGEYSGPEEIDYILEKVRKDIDFIRKHV